MDIPPRKHHHHHHHHHHPEDESLMTSAQKFLPSAGSDSDSDDPYSSDHFRMYEFKVRRCTRSRSHDWTDCPFAHPGEKARRRDPRRHHYSGTVCPDYRRGGCGRGDACEFAHGVFECWLHPARYRTEACKDGKHCTRKVCFFAHSPRQLRLLHDDDSVTRHRRRHLTKTTKLAHNTNSHSSSSSSSPCLFCSNCPHHHNSSPTSTLLGLSHLSPPLSPMSVTDLMEAMHLADAASPMPAKRSAPSLPWLDVSSFCDTGAADQTQFLLSPSTPGTAAPSVLSPDSLFAGRRYSHNMSAFSDDHHQMAKVSSGTTDFNGGGGCSSSDPDLGWVNELLM